MFKILPILFLPLLALSCDKDPDYCVGCSNEYPYYNDSHLKTSAQAISSLPSVPAFAQADLQKLKKVIVFPASSRRQTVVGFADQFLSALEKKGWKVFDSDTQIRSEDPVLDIQAATGFEKPDIVAFYMTEMPLPGHSPINFYQTWELLPRANFLKVSILEDFNYPWHINNASYFYQHADVILARYPEAFQQLETDCGKPIFHFPHAASRPYFEAKNDFTNKKQALLLSGTIHKRWYPLRAKALELFEANNSYLFYRRHPGYAQKMDPIQEARDYATQIAQYQLALTGAGMGISLAAPYILAKHFEIPATGTVVVTDKFVEPMMKRLGFIENEHYLASTPNTLEADLARWLAPENQANLERIGIAGQKLVSERHTLEKRVEEFEQVVYWAWVNKK